MTPAKRIFDILFALLFAPILVPVIAVVAVLLLLTQGRPVFYAAERMQTPTRAFRLWKFRTMRVVEEDAGVSGAHKSDRITPLGAALRRCRIDEMPQLWNILRGDISFVGPRPPLREYVERFPEVYGDVLKSRPGVTGLASILCHRYEARVLAACRTPEETDRVYVMRCIPLKARLDRIYARHASVCFDILLLWRTMITILK